MQTKTFEICDNGTFIPALAVKLSPECEQDRYLLARAGYGSDAVSQARYVILMKLGNPKSAHYDPGCWPWSSRTMTEAHKYIRAHFDELPSGAVVDVEYILGERKEPKASESETVAE